VRDIVAGASMQEADGDRRALLTMLAAQWVGMRVPRRYGILLSQAFLRAAHRSPDGQRRVVAENLARVLGHPPGSPFVLRAVEEAIDLYGRYWYETFALRTMPAEEVNRRFTIAGVEHIDDAVAAGRGVVMGLPHMGNWDAAGHWLALNGYRMTAVAEELKPRSVFELFYRHRRALGMDIVPLTSGKRVGERLVGVLADNRILTLLADRNLSGRGVEVQMFGAWRRMPSGPAMLSLAAGAPLLPCAIFTTDEGWHCHIDAPIQIERTNDLRTDVAAVTRTLAGHFERYISAAPADWHMFQPAWDGAPESAT
jgi:phosphatidylinositol dimannoside acyltransferase